MLAASATAPLPLTLRGASPSSRPPPPALPRGASLFLSAAPRFSSPASAGFSPWSPLPWPRVVRAYLCRGGDFTSRQPCDAVAVGGRGRWHWRSQTEGRSLVQANTKSEKAESQKPYWATKQQTSTMNTHRCATSHQTIIRKAAASADGTSREQQKTSTQHIHNRYLETMTSCSWPMAHPWGAPRDKASQTSEEGGQMQLSDSQSPKQLTRRRPRILFPGNARHGGVLQTGGPASRRKCGSAAGTN